MVPDWVAIFWASYYAGNSGLLRTQLQKTLYFAAQKGILEDSFGRGYYGPFSSNIANSAESLVNKNFLDETIEFFPGAIGYRYRLSNDGKKVTPMLEKKTAQNAKELRRIVQICRDRGSKSLSIAAKVHYILKTMGISMTFEEIAAHAELLNWDISKDEVEAASRLLQDLELVE